MPPEATHSGFRTTHWTLVADLHADDAARREHARATLIKQAWPAVYSWLRHSDRGTEDAAELTQAFFVDVVLARSLLESAQRNKGRFRTLLLTALQRFIIDGQRRKAIDPSRRPISINELSAEESRLAGIRCSAADAERCALDFDHRWALSALHEALRRCEHHFVSHGRPSHWRLFEARILTPCAHACAPPPLDAISHELGFAGSAAAAAAIQTVKLRLSAILREVVGESVDDQDLEAELQFIIRRLANPAAGA